MKAWWPVAIAICVPGGCVLALAVYLRKRWVRRAAAQVETLIHPPRVIFIGHDDTLRVRAQARRDLATRFKNRGRKVDSGAPVSDLRAVK